MSSIGTLNEKSLHAALKDWCLRPGDRTEVSVEGYVIDIVRGDQLIEIQTANFSAIKTKLRSLVEHYPVRLFYPISRQKWILRQPPKGQPTPSRRKSPKRGSLLDIFDELVSFPDLLAHRNFSLHILAIEEEEVRRFDGRRGWRRRGWVTHDRRLLAVLEEHILAKPADLAFVLPSSLCEPFTTADLAGSLKTNRRQAQKIVYCLSRMGLLIMTGKQGRAHLYRREPL